MNQVKITFIGAGNMARALISGLIANGYDPNNIWVSNPSPEKLLFFKQNFNVHTSQDNQSAIRFGDIIILTIKPLVFPIVCQEIRSLIEGKKVLIISVAMGVTVNLLHKWLSVEKPLSIIRAMPNTPASVGAGATGLFANENVLSADKNIAESIFRAVGMTLWLKEESHIDIVTALTGSGPAYFFLIMEALEEISTKMGLDREDAKLLLTETMLGASRMALESGYSIKDLRLAITSPQGCTEQAVKVLEQGNIRKLFSDALTAGVERVKEVTKLLETKEG